MANPKIVDTTRRVAFDGSARHPGFVLPIIRDRIDAGSTVAGLALVEALWARMCAGMREDGSQIQPNDPLWDTLTVHANEAKANPMAWVDAFQFYDSLKSETRFTDEFQYWLKLIWADGVETALNTYLSK